MIDIKNIRKEYLRSLPSLSEKEALEKEAQDHIVREKIRMGKVSAEDIRLPSVKESATTLFHEILPKSSSLQAALAREEDAPLNKASWKDFSLLAGNPKNPESSVLNRIKRTRTHAGTCVMATALVNPNTDAAVVVKQQQTLKCIRKIPKVRKLLDREMTSLAKRERMRIAFWQKRSDINSPIFQQKIGGFYYKRLGFSALNRSPAALQFSKIFGDWHRQLALTVFALIVVPYIAYCAYWGKDLETHYRRIVLGINPLRICFVLPPSLGFFGSLLHHLKLTLVPFLFFFQNSHFFSEIEVGDYMGVFDAYMAGKLNFEETIFIFSLESIKLGSWWLFISHIRKRKGTINFLAVHMTAFQEMLYHAHRICRIVALSPRLKRIYGHQLRKTWKVLQVKKGPLGDLVHNLRTKDFSKRRYFFGNTCELLVTYKLLDEHKDAFTDLIYEMAHLDVQLGLVKLMEEHQEGVVKNPVTLGSFEEPIDNHPRLQAKGMWHPFLDVSQAISNDVEMDVNRAFFIITGPNAGGKSTYILSVGVNTILNQCFGIVYAKQFNQTMFYKIITYINVIQDLSRGLSLAEAGMEVLRIHKKILARVDKPVLAIVDEILNGVDPKVAEKYSYKILEQRSPENPNCLNLVTTHLMNLTGLSKKDKRFHNKKVIVNIPGKAGRPFDYTYQIHDGVADQNVVEMMLESKGVI